jgi:cobyric acid synthase
MSSCVTSNGQEMGRMTICQAVSAVMPPTVQKKGFVFLVNTSSGKNKIPG